MSETDKINLLRSFIRHREFVADALERVADALRHRARVHDLSKLADDEFEGFSRINAAARVHKFGSPEYAENMKQERPTIDLHFRRNTHHPEFTRMTFLDVIEMVCDWHGARAGYDDPRTWADTVKLNFEHKSKYLSPEQLWLAEQVAAFLAAAAREEEGK
jgi:hypothetical protein